MGIRSLAQNRLFSFRDMYLYSHMYSSWYLVFVWYFTGTLLVYTDLMSLPWHAQSLGWMTLFSCLFAMIRLTANKDKVSEFLVNIILVFLCLHYNIAQCPTAQQCLLNPFR